MNSLIVNYFWFSPLKAIESGDIMLLIPSIVFSNKSFNFTILYKSFQSTNFLQIFSLRETKTKSISFALKLAKKNNQDAVQKDKLTPKSLGNKTKF